MKRSISSLALLSMSVSAILGSGWLFSAYYSAKYAGPAVLLSWIFGGILVLIIAFVFAELSTVIPVSGSSARIPHYTHGSVVSFIFAWMVLLSYSTLCATEVQAVIQYANFFIPHLTNDQGGLTSLGYAVAIACMLLISIINIFSLRWLVRCNNFLTIFKVAIPLGIALTILAYYFSVGHVLHPNHTPSLPFGFHGVVVAIASGGIVYSFNGFKQACELAGEAKNPKFALPFAIVGSIVLCLIIFLLLQLAFLTSLTSVNLKEGWSHLFLLGNGSPIQAILVQDRLKFLSPLLYVAAVLGPFAAALMYCSSAGRSLYGMSKNGYLPKFFQVLSAQGNPIYGIVTNFVLGMLTFMPFSGWQSMVTFLSSILAVTYCIGPICLIALRSQVPNAKQAFRLPFGMVWAYVAYYLCTLLIYWAGWDVVSKLIIALGAGAVILVIYYSIKQPKQALMNWRASIWLWVYFFGVALISHAGNFGGGSGQLQSPWDYLYLALLCLYTADLSLRYKLSAKSTLAYLGEFELKPNPIEN